MAQETNIQKGLEEKVQESVLSKLRQEGFLVESKNLTGVYKLTREFDIEIRSYGDGSMCVSLYPPKLPHQFGGGVDYLWEPRRNPKLLIQTISRLDGISVQAKKGRGCLIIKNPPVEEVILHYNPKSLEKSE